jgi:hypothetical protein
VIGEGKFTTTFDGSRMPKYALPQPNSLATFIKVNYLENYKAQILKEGSSTLVEETEPTILDPENAAERESNVLPSDQQCQIKALDKYDTLPYVDAERSEATLTELKTLIDSNVTANVSIKRLILALLLTRNSNLFKDNKIQILNNNMFGISAAAEWNDRPEIKKLVCFDNGYTSEPLFAFDNRTESLNMIKDYYKSILPIIQNLKILNKVVGVADEDAEKAAIAQVIYTTWDTLLAFDPTPLTADQIKDTTLLNIQEGRFPKTAYDEYKKVVERVQSVFT